MFLQCFQGGHIVVTELQALVCAVRKLSQNMNSVSLMFGGTSCRQRNLLSLVCEGPEVQHSDESVPSAAGYLSSKMQSRSVFVIIVRRDSEFVF